MKINKIEIHYFDACPSWKQTQKILQEALNDLGIADKIGMMRIETNEEAVLHQFTGSPTIRINGHDIFPISQDSYALGCRVYKTPDGIKGSPTKEMILAKLATILDL